MVIQPGADNDLTDPNTPGSPFWWLKRLGQRLIDRQPLYDIREDYASGNHPLPQGDKRYVKALKDFQQKAKTNYVELVQRATTQKMRVKGFRFGEAGELDKDAAKIWKSNDMDFQAPIIIQTAAKLGFTYALVSPPEEEGGSPIITVEDPRLCEIEKDPTRITRSLAGMKMWVDSITGLVTAVLYLPDAVYTFEATSTVDSGTLFHNALSERGFDTPSNLNAFSIIEIQPNPLGEVPLVRGEWEPDLGERGRAEGECGWDIQDRINKTVLDRLVISNSQAFRQRWVTGRPPDAPRAKSQWDPGADMVWASTNPDTKFGDFAEADIKQILEAVRDDVGDYAAITQTPSTYLTNRMVNVSGDTLAQAQAGHISKIRLRHDAMGFFFEKLQKLCFRYTGDERANDPTASTVWMPVESKSVAESADALGKWVAAGIPLQLAMDKLGDFDPAEIAWAVEEQKRQQEEALAREDELLDRQAQAAEAQAKAGPGKTSSQEEK